MKRAMESEPEALPETASSSDTGERKPPAPQSETGGVPTGIGSDIARQIKLRKQRNAEAGRVATVVGESSAVTGGSVEV